MKTIAILTMCAAMAGCAVAPVESAPAEQGLICGDNCDPGNFQALMSSVIGAGGGLGSRLPGTMACYHYEGGYDPNGDGWHPAHDECAETRQDPWGQQYRVSCNTLAGVGCNHYACGYDPSQLPCS